MIAGLAAAITEATGAPIIAGRMAIAAPIPPTMTGGGIPGRTSANRRLGSVWFLLACAASRRSASGWVRRYIDRIEKGKKNFHGVLTGGAPVPFTFTVLLECVGY